MRKKKYLTGALCLTLACSMILGTGCASSVKVDEKKVVMGGEKKNEMSIEESAYQAFTYFMDEYIVMNNDDSITINDTAFWDLAEIFEVIIDAYERTGNERYYDMIHDYFDGFKKRHSVNWMSNKYNDDLMWISIACARAYRCTGDEEFLRYAKKYVDYTWDRAWSDDLGGGLWWRIENETKNACVNCPGAIAAALVGDLTGDEEYYKMADDAMNFVVENLYEPDTGHVYDSYNIKGEKNQWASTYNQGTFIGANTMLYLHTGKEIYLERARKAADYTINVMFKKKVMNSEDSDTNRDLPGFKGILARWLYFFAVNCDQSDVMEYLQLNAKTAWNNRNKKGIIWTKWDESTTNYKEIIPFSASTAISVLHNCNDSGKTSYVATEAIDPYDFTRCGKAVIEHADGYITINVEETDAFLEYACIYDLDKCKKVVLTASAPSETKIEIRTGSEKGPVAATLTIPKGTAEKPAKVKADFKNTEGNKRIYITFPENKDGIVIKGFTFSAK